MTRLTTLSRWRIAPVVWRETAGWVENRAEDLRTARVFRPIFFEEVISDVVNETRRTPLYDEHVRLGARMIPFGGWEMPVSYRTGIIAEHHATRHAAGLFDLSHMGEYHIAGPDAPLLLDTLLTNKAGALAPGHAMYSPMCRDDGTIVDDVMLYRLEDGALPFSNGPQPAYLLVVNAANIAKDWTWIDGVARRLEVGTTVTVHDASATTALIAVQGPRAAAILARLAGGIAAVPRFGVAPLTIGGTAVVAARTGYTGEDGFELFLPAEDAADLWRLLLDEGRGEGLLPVGLGARDTLRLEARLCLYGNDIDDTTTPLEAGLNWTLAWDKPTPFVGRDALQRQKQVGVSRRLVGLMMDDRAVPRQGSLVRVDGRDAGSVTSGTVSPTLEKGIGLAYVPPALTSPGTALAVSIRNVDHPAHTVKTPFYTRERHA